MATSSFGIGIAAGEASDKLLKAADLLQSLNIGIDVMDTTDAKVELTPNGVKLQSIICKLTFKEPLG